MSVDCKPPSRSPDAPATEGRALGQGAGWIGKAVLAVVALIAILIVAGVWYLRANPLEIYEQTTRRELAKAGLEPASLETSAGRMVYWQGGAGPTLVFLHGAGDQAGAFQGVVGGLVADYRVLIPDIPGHGDSEPAAGPLKMSVMYAGVEEFLAAVAGDEPAVLVGSSMGGWLALIHAHRRPAAVARVIGINASGLKGERTDLSLTPADREAARRLMEALRDPASEPLPDFVLDDIVERTAAGPIGRMSAEWEELEAHLLEGRLGEIEVPVDLIWGESDQLLPLAYAERLRDGLPRARLTTIEKCGHHPANECPAKLADALARVLAMEPPPAAPPIPAGADAEDATGAAGEAT